MIMYIYMSNLLLFHKENNAIILKVKNDVNLKNNYFTGKSHMTSL